MLKLDSYAIALRTVWRSFYYRVRYWGSDIFVHPAAWVSRKAILRCTGGGRIYIGAGCEIGDFALLDAFGGQIKIGTESSVNPFCVLYGHGGLSVGNDVRIATNTVIVPANHRFSNDALIRCQGLTQRGIAIADNVWIGCNVAILDGVTIGAGSVIGAGAVVTRSVPARHLAIGVSAAAKPIMTDQQMS